MPLDRGTKTLSELDALLTGVIGPAGRPADEVLNGIAWDAENKRLFVTGKRWPRLFEIRVRP